MPSLIDIRRRVRAVKATQQITKAMKMVAASKLRRAQQRMTNARPYARQMRRVLGSLASRVDPSVHPLLAVREPRAGSTTLVIVVSADKGLCGSFNTNVVKAASGLILSLTDAERPGASRVTLGLVGRKGRDFFRRRGFDVAFEQVGLFQRLRYADAEGIAKFAIEAFMAGTVDTVTVVYNDFKSVMQQRVAVERLLPIPRGDIEASQTHGVERAAGAGAPGIIEYLYEPSAQVIFDHLLPRHVEVQIYRALLESNAAFYAAQMTAMDTATKNSAEMISQLTLYMNKVRQAAITREIIEVVSGAEAL